MIQVALLTGLRHLGRHKLRVTLTLLGIVVGVATFVFAPTLAASVAASLGAAIDDLVGRADLEVRGPSQGFSARTLTGVRADAHVALAAPLAQTGGVLLGEAEPLAIFGIDPKVDREARAYALATGRWLTRSGDALLAERYAEEKGLGVGDSVTVIGPGGAIDLRVAGVLAESGVGRINGGDLVVAHLSDVFALRGDRNLDSIAIRLKPGAEAQATADRLRRALPDTLEVDTPDTRRGPLDDIQGVINFVTTFSSTMVLGVGSTLVFNTMSVAVAQRRAEIGVLRALGVTRSGVRAMFLIESGLMGLIGSPIGIALGYALVQVSGDAINLSAMFGVSLVSVSAPAVPGWLPFVALIAGVGMPTLAGYLPSRAASQVDPVEALTGVKADLGFSHVSRRRIAAGVLVLIGCGIVIALYATSDRKMFDPFVALAQVVAAELLMVAGVILLLPGILISLGRALPALTHRVFGVTGLLAAENLTKRSKRMAATATVMLVGAWAGVVVSSSIFGYRDFVSEWEASENVWDLTVGGAGASTTESIISLPDGLPRAIAARRGVAATAAERITSIDYKDREIDIRAIDIARFRAQGARLLWNTGDEATAYDRLRDRARPALLLSGMAALTLNLQPGDAITLDTPRGPVTFEIAGTVLGVTGPARPDDAGVVMDLQVYRDVWRDRRVDRLLVKLAPGVDAQAERRAIQDDYAEAGIVVISPAQLSAALSESIQSISVTSQVLSALLSATLILGMANTMTIVVLDRRREAGLLRAVGLFGRQIAASIVMETVLLMAIAGALAVPMGIVNNYVNTLTMQNLFAMRFALAPDEVLKVLGLGLAAAALAAFVPARQAGQVDVLEALRYE
jgi:putative ABC transport system permease protein